MTYEDCLAHILAAEGGYVHDPTDRGGATNKGITQKTYNAWSNDDRSVEFITDEEVSIIYKEGYWVADLPNLVDLCVFDAAVQHGRARAVRWLQTVVGCAVDGIMGRGTLYAVNTYRLTHGLKELLDNYLALRRAFYKAIIHNDPTQRRFERGWNNRLEKLEISLKCN